MLLQQFWRVLKNVENQNTREYNFPENPPRVSISIFYNLNVNVINYIIILSINSIYMLCHVRLLQPLYLSTMQTNISEREARQGQPV